MNKLEEKRAERKNIILTQAKKLILERGISDGIMSELAMRSGISRQRLYEYYRNIDDVLYDIMQLVYDNTHLDHLQTIDDAPASVIRYSILLFPDISDDVHDDLLFLSLYSVYLATNKKENVKRNKQNFVLFRNQIQKGQEQGIFRTDHTTEELSAVVTHLLTSFLYHSETLEPQTFNTIFCEEVLNYYADMILAYLAKK